jgi:hypothetical protein
MLITRKLAARTQFKFLGLNLERVLDVRNENLQDFFG